MGDRNAGTAQSFSKTGHLGCHDTTDRDLVARTRAIGGNEQIDCGDTAFVELAFPSVAEHLAVAKAFDGLDEIGSTEHMRWDTEIRVTGCPQREVESESLTVQHDGHSADQAVVALRSRAGHRLTDVSDRSEPTVHCC